MIPAPCGTVFLHSSRGHLSSTSSSRLEELKSKDPFDLVPIRRSVRARDRDTVPNVFAVDDLPLMVVTLYSAGGARCWTMLHSLDDAICLVIASALDGCRLMLRRIGDVRNAETILAPPGECDRRLSASLNWVRFEREATRFGSNGGGRAGSRP